MPGPLMRGLALVIVIAGAAGTAAGDPLPDPRIAKADQLFTEGRALLATNIVQACDKFTESLRLNAAAIGTILNVALCDEKLGRIASAVARFTEARDRAKEQGLPEHMRAAEEHIAALTPDVPHIAIKLTEPLPETSIVLDDRVVAADALDDIAVDPGERVIVVSAPQRLPYRAAFVINRAEHQDVVIPALARSITVTSSRHRIGQITTIAGAAAAGTGLGLGLYARSLFNRQFDAGSDGSAHCVHRDGVDLCDATGQDRTGRARTLGNVGTIVGVAGLVTAGVGVYLWLRSPAPHSEAAPAVTVAPELRPDGLGVVALGHF